MKKTVKKMSVSYDPINEDNAFSSGGFITGRITLELSKETTISSLSIKAKGEAYVAWTSGEDNSFTAYESCLNGQEYELLPMGQSGETHPSVVAPGTHVYPFIIQIPERNMPSSFYGSYGHIAYTLEAKLSRLNKTANKTANTYFTFHSKAERISPELLAPWSRTVEKKMKWFTSGHVSMRVTIEKTGYIQGETLKVMAEIVNNSSRALTLKFGLHRWYRFIVTDGIFLRYHESSHRIFKVVGERVPSSARQDVIKVMSLPPDLMASLFHCSIIEVEYTLLVYLDVPYAKKLSPVVNIPLVIFPNTYGLANMTQPAC